MLGPPFMIGRSSLAVRTGVRPIELDAGWNVKGAPENDGFTR